MIEQSRSAVWLLVASLVIDWRSIRRRLRRRHARAPIGVRVPSAERGGPGCDRRAIAEPKPTPASEAVPPVAVPREPATPPSPPARREPTAPPASRESPAPSRSAAARPTPERPSSRRTPPPPLPPPASATSGRYQGGLTVDSRPTGARVFLDGRLVGTTPLTIAAVPAGEHAIRLERDGYRRWSSSVRVVAAEQNRVTASLER